MALLITACLFAQSDSENSFMPEKLYHIPDNCDFMSIVSNNFENECSPKLVDPFFSSYVGILINGPKEIVWPGDHSLEDYPPNIIGQTKGPLRLMVAGLIQAKYSTLGLRGQFSYHVVVVAVNEKTAETYSGKMPRGDFEPYPNKPDVAGKPKREDLEKYRESLYSSNFNLDLVHDLGLPIADATYKVYATLGEYKSNVLTIKTVVK